MKKNFYISTLFMLATLIITIYYINQREIPEEISYEEEIEEALPQPELKFGLPVDSFDIGLQRISWNETIATILNKYNIPFTTINMIPSAAKDILDIRKIKAGNNYYTFCQKDSAASLQYFVYEHSPIDYFVFDFTDSLCITKGQKDVKSITKKQSGIIENSLWECMLDNDINPMIAIRLSEIFAWTVDFFRLKKGDYFKVIYDEEYVDSTAVGISKIHAAMFNHMDEPLYAIPFVQDDAESYYDLDGKSLRREFLKAPLRFSRISSGYSYRRLHPVLKYHRPHLGVDYAAARGTPVYAIGDGIITKKVYTRGGGNTLRIRHNSVYTTGYLHLSGYAKGIRAGTKVKQGQLIGYVGSTGLSTGPHLDFRFWKNGHPVNPLKVEAPPVKPIKKEYREAYDSVKYIFVNKLRDIKTPGQEKHEDTNLQANTDSKTEELQNQ